MKPHCMNCTNFYKGKSEAFECLIGKDPDNCDSFEIEQICCFDCQYYDVNAKSCELKKTVPGAFARHTCTEYARAKGGK